MIASPSQQIAAQIADSMKAQLGGDAMAVLVQLLRRILRLSENATVEDINRALFAADSLSDVVALSASNQGISTRQIVQKALMITAASFERYGADASLEYAGLRGGLTLR